MSRGPASDKIPLPDLDEEINPPPASSGRLVSLDVFRGLTVAGMILVNNPGNGGTTFSPLRHADWNGWTPTDLVFPFFLFIVGVSITFALSKRLESTDGTKGVVGKIIRRSLIIFLLGLFLNKFPFYKQSWQEIQSLDHWKTLAAGWRIPGVLQRIALCYLVTSLIFLKTGVRGQVIAIAAILGGYWALLRYVAVAGFEPGDLARGHELGSYLDRLILTPAHLYKKDYDPEGLLSTLPAIATTLFGVLAGHWLRSGRERYQLDSGLFVAGTSLVVLGLFWNMVYPINKALWTGSFVLLTSGLAMVGLGVCYWLVDLQGYRRLFMPFRVFGSNAIAAYALAGMGVRYLNAPLIERTGKPLASVHSIYYDEILRQALGPYQASLAYSISLVFVCFLIIGILDLLNIHIRA